MPVAEDVLPDVVPEEMTFPYSSVSAVVPEEMTFPYSSVSAVVPEEMTFPYSSVSVVSDFSFVAEGHGLGPELTNGFFQCVWKHRDPPFCFIFCPYYSTWGGRLKYPQSCKMAPRSAEVASLA